MPEGRAPWRRLALLALVVLALHLWLLGAGPRLVQPMARATPWTARTIAQAPPPPAAAAVAPVVAPVAIAQARRPAHRAAPQPSQAPEAPAIPVTPVAATPPPPLPVAPVAQAQPYVLPPAARIRYKLTAQSRGITLGGEGELSWKHDGQKYEAQLKASAPLLPTRTQTSIGTVTAEGLAPRRFSDKSRNEEAAHFEHESGKVVFSSNRPEAALQPGAQDRLSVLLQLGAMIAGAPHKFPPGTSIAIQTASAREAEPWTFSIDGMQTLELPGGTVEALKLTRQPRREYDVKVELWLAPGMAYVPVRLRLTQRNGDWVDQQWSSTDRG